MIEIFHLNTKEVLYRSETAITIREANLGGANLGGADLRDRLPMPDFAADTSRADILAALRAKSVAE